MRVLLVGGDRVNDMINSLKGVIQNRGIEIFGTKHIEDIENILTRGDTYDRIIMLEKSWNTKDILSDLDYSDIANRINDLAEDILEAYASNSELIFITVNEKMAELVFDETIGIAANKLILCKKPPYSVAFFGRAVVEDMDKFQEMDIYNPKVSVENVGTIEVEETKRKKDIVIDTVKVVGKVREIEFSGVDPTEIDISDYDIDEDDYEDGGGDDYSDYEEAEDIETEKDIQDRDEADFSKIDEDEYSDLDLDNVESIEIEDVIDIGVTEEIIEHKDKHEFEEIETEESEIDKGIPNVEGIDSLNDVEIEDSIEIPNETDKKIKETQENVKGRRGLSRLSRAANTKTEEKKKPGMKRKKKLEEHEEEEVYKPKKKRGLLKKPKDEGNGSSIRELLDSYAARSLSILVTGSSGSGCSTLAYNLANSLSNIGYNVLLVDTDSWYKPHSYISETNYRALEIDSAGLVGAFRKGYGIAEQVAVAKPGLKILTMGLGSDQIEFSEVVRDESKILTILNTLRLEYQFIIYDMHLKEAVRCGKNITAYSDIIMCSVDMSSDGVTKMMLDISNSDNPEIRGTLLNRSNIVFNRCRGINMIMGKKIKNHRDVLSIIDNRILETLGEDPGEYFSTMGIVGEINYMDVFDEAWYTNKHYSDTKEGIETYINILANILLNRRK